MISVSNKLASALLLLSSITYLYGSDDRLHSVFGNSFCREALRIITQEKYDLYLAEALKNGASNPPEIKEYIERRKRVEYLSDESRRADNEYKASMPLIKKAVDLTLRVSNGGFLRPEDVKRISSKIIGDFLTRWPSLSVPNQRFNSLLIDIYEIKPPASISELEVISDLITLRMGMANRRFIISENLIKLPLYGSIREVPEQDLLMAVLDGDIKFIAWMLKDYNLSKFLAERMLDSLTHDEYGFDDMDQGLSNQISRKKNEMISRIFMNSKVPRSIKGELGIELDFNEKLNAEGSSILFSKFVELVADYFGVGSGSNPEAN